MNFMGIQYEVTTVMSRPITVTLRDNLGMDLTIHPGKLFYLGDGEPQSIPGMPGQGLSYPVAVEVVNYIGDPTYVLGWVGKQVLEDARVPFETS